MQSLNVKKGSLKSSIKIPASKSYANRALIIAAITKDSPKIFNLPDSSDVINLIKALKQLGLKTIEDDGFQFINTFPSCETSDQIIQVGDGGTTARFMAVLALLGQKTYHLELKGKLKDRPWDEFINITRNLSAHAELAGNVLTVKGPAKFPANLQIDCSRTTQFATAFSLISPISGCSITPVQMESSQSYWKMTEAITQHFYNHSLFNVPLDWSSASYPLAFGALNHNIHLPGLHFDPYQADAKFFEMLKELGCIEENADGILVKPLKSSQSIDVDVSDCLDLVPALGYFLAHLPGNHKLSGIQNLVHKESDRLTEVIKLLTIFNRKAYKMSDTLIIEGSSEMIDIEKTLNMPDDHRMVMAGTLFLRHHHGGTISPAEAVKKSYPDFFLSLS